MLETIVRFVVIIMSIVIHEMAHGYTAYLLGDKTAANAGRLSFNPIRHLDPFGSIILPFLMVAFGGPMIGYAKPVPYNPNNLRNPKRDEVLVALAGPLSNFILAFVACGLLVAFDFSYYALLILQPVMLINLSLMFFNLIPFPPLDGSSIISLFLPKKAMKTYYKIQYYSMPILLGVLYVLPAFFHIDIISVYLSYTIRETVKFMMGMFI